MTSTPPPPERLATPPTPLHGAVYDSYEPFSSPRRSRRVAAQSKSESSTKHTSPRSKRTASHLDDASDHPSTSVSPSSPVKRSAAKKIDFDARSDGMRVTSDTDSDTFVRKPSALDPFTSLTTGMLPTPSKTPAKSLKKRLAQSTTSASFGSTSRILFPGRPATIDEVMPSPRKNRKKHSAFSLPSFAEECDDDAGAKIEIYTDSKERIPTYDDEEDNPFFSRPSDEERKARAGPRTRSRAQTEEEEEMVRKARNDEGMIYIFRGKKIFRPFTHSSDEQESDSDDAMLGGVRLRRRAGATACRPLPRASIKPRLLFPNTAQRKAREDASAINAEEEATTDVESARSFTSAPRATVATVTPAKQRFRNAFEAATPPPSGRTTRSATKKEVEFADVPAADSGVEEEWPILRKPEESKKTKTSPFDTWHRGKSSLKREGDPLDNRKIKKSKKSTAQAQTSAEPSAQVSGYHDT